MVEFKEDEKKSKENGKHTAGAKNMRTRSPRRSRQITQMRITTREGGA